MARSSIGRVRGWWSRASTWFDQLFQEREVPIVGVTSNPDDPRLGRGVDAEPVPQHEVYLVLSEEERAEGFVPPVRSSYRHLTCGMVTTMGRPIAETYARNPSFYGATFCVGCGMHRPVGEGGEFVWVGTNIKVGT
jgi:hypothetical protein